MRKNKELIKSLILTLILSLFTESIIAKDCSPDNSKTSGFRPNVLSDKGTLYIPSKKRTGKLLLYFPGLHQARHPTNSVEIFANSSYKLQEVAEQTGYSIFSLYKYDSTISAKDIKCLMEASQSGQLDVASHSGGVVGLEKSAAELKRAHVSNLFMLDNFYNSVNRKECNPTKAIKEIDAAAVYGFTYSTKSTLKSIAKVVETKSSSYYTFSGLRNSTIIPMNDHYDSVSKFLIGFNLGTLNSSYNVDESLVQAIHKRLPKGNKGTFVGQ